MFEFLVELNFIKGERDRIQDVLTALNSAMREAKGAENSVLYTILSAFMEGDYAVAGLVAYEQDDDIKNLVYDIVKRYAPEDVMEEFLRGEQSSRR